MKLQRMAVFSHLEYAKCIFAEIEKNLLVQEDNYCT